MDVLKIEFTTEQRNICRNLLGEGYMVDTSKPNEILIRHRKKKNLAVSLCLNGVLNALSIIEVKKVLIVSEYDLTARANSPRLYFYSEIEDCVVRTKKLLFR
jgi:hypothetical protein